MVKYNYCLPSELLIYNPDLHPAAPRSAQSSSGNHNWLWNGGVLGHCTDVEMSPKTYSGKALTSLSEIKVDSCDSQFIRMGHFLLAQAENDVQPPFLVHRSLQTSSTVQ